jgi:hypothetical protein
MAGWTDGKGRRVLVLLALIVFLSASFLTLDWTQYFLDQVRISDPELMYTRAAKTLTSLLIFLLALSVGRDGLDPADTRRLRHAFIAIFCGDLLFLLDEIHPAFDYPAVLAFLVGQVLIILRNGQGLRGYLRGRSAGGQLGREVAMGVGILLMTAVLFVGTLLGHLRGSPMLPIIAVYAVVLDLSLWTGWMTLRTGHFPRRNAALIAAGATCFFVGDYLVGFNLSLEPSLQRATTVFLTWVFYTPAITLFALSGYRWGGEEIGERSL